MDDPRSMGILGMATSLIASGAPQYANRTISDVAGELMSVGAGVDHALSGCDCGQDEPEEGTLH